MALVAAGGDSGHVHEDDALQFVAAKNSKRYDVVLSDLWNGGNEGRALLRPFFEQVRSNVLRPNGTMALNLVAFSDGPHVGLAVNVVRTCSLRHLGTCRRTRNTIGRGRGEGYGLAWECALAGFGCADFAGSQKKVGR